MTTTVESRVYNFSAGPAVLPEPVLRTAQQDLWSIDGTGIGILEHSHRGPTFTRILEEAVADCREVAGISDEYEVLFLQGGATLQFAMVPMSFLGDGRTADYLDTGVWTTKAIAEAKTIGSVHLAYEGATSDYDHTPSNEELRPSANPAYTWYCSNNTIYGTQYAEPPQPTGAAGLLVCDASSDIFSRPIDIDRHAVLFAGAQKNLGPAGCTLLIIRRDFMEGAREDLPAILSYSKHAAAGSRLNTSPTFPIYVMGRVFKWILAEGGLEAMDRRNRAKAAVIYEVIDSSDGFYRAVARPDSRSQMNIAFRTPSTDLDQAFLDQAAQHDMGGLKGHRSVGGLRASVYNAFPAAGCDALAQFMRDFAQAS